MTWKLINNQTKQSIDLPQDMRWEDEFSWNKVAQSAPVYTLTGAMIIQQGTKKAGRPITLTGDWVWHKRADLETLRDWTDSPNLTMTLIHYDGREFSVIWRLHDNAIQAEPVYYQTPEQDNEPYIATLQFMII
ncbi:MAG: hypothetical protein KGV51_03480 [Moraxellaceae bacterium]|nr:hypothetical protein [Moraxellaceae bacterium]